MIFRGEGPADLQHAHAMLCSCRDGPLKNERTNERSLCLPRKAQAGHPSHLQPGSRYFL
ncbi:uncharacterized protein K444DRAFT_607999 [Hyaloscypha bicolor E]|uniref:Uncharacterized protein n=1 Tax=Hyaloscypha bicolor E TaxID=1095630 RepID=A0A2J6TQZ4_9HELO|nr:uncharacterized protein K444DRAFT_607999 [Hyaloscypha bicolor E]PMD65430.1 hypothetical protein K444DRAFT_607999 [Hyaloscypha bicolor E]